MIVSYINDLLEPLNTIVNLDIPNLNQALVDLTNYFVELAVPLVKVVDSFISGLVSVFVGIDINESVNTIKTLVLEALTGNIPDIPEELEVIYKFIYCFLEMINDLLVALFTFQFI